MPRLTSDGATLNLLLKLLLGGAVFFVCIIAMTMFTVIFVKHVQQQVYRKTQSKTIKGKGKQRGSLASRTVWQFVWFLAVFYLMWLIQFAALFVIPPIPSNYLLYVCAAMLGPLQGFLNALVVFCHDRKSLQRWVSQSTKKLLSLFSTKFTTETLPEECGFPSRAVRHKTA